jgi:Flp pilus assembly protein TadD
VQGRFGEACTFAREAQALEPVSPYVSAILGSALMLNGQNTDALAELERGRDLAHDSLHVLWISGALDEAFDLLEQGYQERSPLVTWLVLPVYDKMRGDARFNDLSRRMKLA